MDILLVVAALALVALWLLSRSLFGGRKKRVSHQEVPEFGSENDIVKFLTKHFERVEHHGVLERTKSSVLNISARRASEYHCGRYSQAKKFSMIWETEIQTFIYFSPKKNSLPSDIVLRIAHHVRPDQAGLLKDLSSKIPSIIDGKVVAQPLPKFGSGKHGLGVIGLHIHAKRNSKFDALTDRSIHDLMYSLQMCQMVTDD